jgi:hypothetical protein
MNGTRLPQGHRHLFRKGRRFHFRRRAPAHDPFERIPVCGLIAHYNATNLPSGPNRLPLPMRAILSKRLSLRGFIVTDFWNERPQFEREMAQWLREGKVKYREDVVDGLENAVVAFKGLFRGHNFGKLLVRVAAEPHRAGASGLRSKSRRLCFGVPANGIPIKRRPDRSHTVVPHLPGVCRDCWVTAGEATSPRSEALARLSPRGGKRESHPDPTGTRASLNHEHNAVRWHKRRAGG